MEKKFRFVNYLSYLNGVGRENPKIILVNKMMIFCSLVAKLTFLEIVEKEKG